MPWPAVENVGVAPLRLLVLFCRTVMSVAKGVLDNWLNVMCALNNKLLPGPMNCPVHSRDGNGPMLSR